MAIARVTSLRRPVGHYEDHVVRVDVLRSGLQRIRSVNRRDWFQGELGLDYKVASLRCRIL